MYLRPLHMLNKYTLIIQTRDLFVLSQNGNWYNDGEALCRYEQHDSGQLSSHKKLLRW